MQKCKSHFGQTTRHARRFGSEPRWFAVFCRVIRNLYYDPDSEGVEFELQVAPSCSALRVRLIVRYGISRCLEIRNRAHQPIIRRIFPPWWNERMSKLCLVHPTSVRMDAQSRLLGWAPPSSPHMIWTARTPDSNELSPFTSCAPMTQVWACCQRPLSR